MICPRCGVSLQVGDFPFCGGKNAHGFQLGMLGEFHERDMGPAFPKEDRYQTSLAELRATERRHGLEALTKQESDSIESRQAQARRRLGEQHKLTAGARRDIIERSIKEVRERSR